MLSLRQFTSHDYVYVADVECQVMFSLVTSGGFKEGAGRGGRLLPSY